MKLIFNSFTRITTNTFTTTHQFTRLDWVISALFLINQRHLLFPNRILSNGINVSQKIIRFDNPIAFDRRLSFLFIIGCMIYHMLREMVRF